MPFVYKLKKKTAMMNLDSRDDWFDIKQATRKGTSQFSSIKEVKTQKHLKIKRSITM